MLHNEFNVDRIISFTKDIIMNDALEKAQKYLHEHIPLTHHLAVSVSHYDGDSVQIAAPLTPNLNHRNTAFGGSISALGILSGWTLLYLKMQELNIDSQLIIQKSTTDFILPVDADFEAFCTLPEESVWNKFQKALLKRGKARIKLNANILVDGKVVSQHEGIYAALRAQNDKES